MVIAIFICLLAGAVFKLKDMNDKDSIRKAFIDAIGRISSGSYPNFLIDRLVDEYLFTKDADIFSMAKDFVSRCIELKYKSMAQNIISFSDEQIAILKGMGLIGSTFVERDLEAGIFDIQPSGRVSVCEHSGLPKFPRAYCLEMVAMLDHETAEDLLLSAEIVQRWLEGGEV